MKCVCGYEGEDFMEHDMVFRKYCEEYKKMPKAHPVYAAVGIVCKETAIPFYACPKCGTLKIEVKE